jgi:hypothetical protein
VPRGHSLRLTAAAAAELCRQAAVAGTPGLMHLDLLEGACEAWAIRLRPGHLAGTPVARADGITLYLSGGGFLVRSGPGVRSCACGAAFSRDN